MSSFRESPVIAVFGASSGALRPGTPLHAQADEILAAAQLMGAQVAKANGILLTGGIGPEEDTVKGRAICGAVAANMQAPWIGISNERTASESEFDEANGLIVRPGLAEKRNYLEALMCDAAIALPGGDGTATEVLFCLYLKRPVILLGWTFSPPQALTSARRRLDPDRKLRSPAWLARGNSLASEIDQAIAGVFEWTDRLDDGSIDQLAKQPLHRTIPAFSYQAHTIVSKAQQLARADDAKPAVVPYAKRELDLLYSRISSVDPQRGLARMPRVESRPPKSQISAEDSMVTSAGEAQAQAKPRPAKTAASAAPSTTKAASRSRAGRIVFFAVAVLLVFGVVGFGWWQYSDQPSATGCSATPKAKVGRLPSGFKPAVLKCNHSPVCESRWCVGVSGDRVA